MSKFKVGDRVRVIVSIVAADQVGCEFVVKSVDGGGWPRSVSEAEYLAHRDSLYPPNVVYAPEQLVLVTKKQTAPLYVFTDIPNDEDGNALVAGMRKHLNKDRYRLRVRGQYLKEGNDWRKYEMGQPIALSKCLRVYVEEK